MRLGYSQIPKACSESTSPQRNFSRIVGSNLTRGVVALGTMLLTSAPLLSRAEERVARATPTLNCPAGVSTVKRDEVLKALENTRGKEIDLNGGVEISLRDLDRMARTEGKTFGFPLFRQALRRAKDMDEKLLKKLVVGKFEMWINPATSEISVFRVGTKVYAYTSPDWKALGKKYEGDLVGLFNEQFRNGYGYIGDFRLSADVTAILVNGDTLVVASKDRASLFLSNGLGPSRGPLNAYLEEMALPGKPRIGIEFDGPDIGVYLLASTGPTNEFIGWTVTPETREVYKPQRACIEEGALAALTPF